MLQTESGVPKPSCFKQLVVCNFYALLRSFASCAHLRSFVRICVFLRPTAFRETAFGNCRLKFCHGRPWEMSVAKA